ncbi:MAG: dUTP diphosphatase [Spirochaetaceae bacterium]|nr:MAG: dUTP diphosphatase [Spirochaetaceae bacterium]
MTVELPGQFPNGNTPRYATDGSAGADISASAEVVLPRGGRALVPTGIRLAIPNGFEGQIRPRSGLALKHGVTVLNSPGTIDSDYRGEIKVLLVNLGEHEYTVRAGDRVAQLIVAPVVRVKFGEAMIPESDRGTGGFGSTGS